MQKDYIQSNEYDSNGNQLTKAQAEFFKDSKVRDNKGNLLVCYHSTDNDFNEFDDEYSYDFGFHFGTLKAAQDRGGYNLKSVYLNAKNIYTMEEDLQYFDAFGFTDYWMRNKQEALKFMSSDTFSELEREWESYIEDGGEDDQSWWCAEYGDVVKDILYNSQYDGIKYMNWAEDAGNYSYMVLYPNQIKSIDNKNPTSSNNVNEKLFEDIEGSGIYLDESKFEPFSIGGNDYPDDYLDEKEFKYFGIMVNDTNVGNMAVNMSYDDTIILEGIEIKPKYRKKGYGKIAIDLLKKMYPDKKSMELKAVPSAKNFYTKIGFTNDGYNDDSGLYYMSSNINEDKQETVKAYHGSQRSNLELSEEPIYLTNDKELAKEFAIGYAFNYDLQEEDEPTLYTIEVKFNNPYYIKSEDEYEDLMDIVNIDITKQFLKHNKYDGIIYQDELDNDLIYYMPLNAKKQCNIVDEEILESYIPERDDAEVEAQQLSTYEAFMNLKGEDDE